MLIFDLLTLHYKSYTMKWLFLCLLSLFCFKGRAGTDLLIKKPLANFIMANLEKDQLRSGSITFLQSGITLPDNLDIALVEGKLGKEHLKLLGRRPLTQEEMSRISMLMTDTAMYERYISIGRDDVATVCPSLSSPEYDVVIELDAVLGGTIVLFMRITAVHFTWLILVSTAMLIAL